MALVTIHYHLRRICISSRRSENPLLFANKVRSDLTCRHKYLVGTLIIIDVSVLSTRGGQLQIRAAILTMLELVESTEADDGLTTRSDQRYPGLQLMGDVCSLPHPCQIESVVDKPDFSTIAAVCGNCISEHCLRLR